jgi:hypothetical protein
MGKVNVNKKCFSTIICLMMLMLIFFPAIRGSAWCGMPMSYIGLKEKRVLVYPNHTSFKQVELHGTAEVTKPPATTFVALELRAKVPDGWGASVNPANFLFTAPGSVTFEVVILVPQGAENGTYTISIVGNLTGPGMSQTAECSTRITVGQYHYLGVKSALVESKPGHRMYYLSIQNMGNGFDRFNMSVMDEFRHTVDGFKFAISPAQRFEFNPGQFHNLTLKITYNDGSPAGTRFITLLFQSELPLYENHNYTRRFQFAMAVTPLYVVKWSENDRTVTFDITLFLLCFFILMSCLRTIRFNSGPRMKMAKPEKSYTKYQALHEIRSLIKYLEERERLRERYRL